MKLAYLEILNFKTIRELEITNIENALILVGRNNTGKSTILDAIRAVAGDYKISETDFNQPDGNIRITVKLQIDQEDLQYLHENGIVSRYKHFDLWEKDFKKKLPSFEDGVLTFSYIFNRNHSIRYEDGYKKHNPYIQSVFPKIYYVDHQRNKNNIQEDVLMLQGESSIAALRENKCIFDSMKSCNQCFSCIGYINQKQPSQLSLAETARLFQYKLFQVNLNTFSERLNKNFAKNGGKSEKISYQIAFDPDQLFRINTVVTNRERGIAGNVAHMSEGLKSIYILSLLETYIETKNIAPYIIIIEEPEIYLHPQLQKVASEILYRLSNKNQVLFSTHSPTMLFNFTTKQIRQVVVDDSYNTIVRSTTDIDGILDDLGFTANDLLNVNFVFIVEGRQDKSRLPLLLRKYYSEMQDEHGNLKRIAIIATNSCTNIKTYANLKYMNTLYLRDQFLMIRDGDGKDRQKLGRQLCKYYGDRRLEDMENIPRVTARNVLILKYYSFENYFLDPAVMTKIGVVKSQDEFFTILYEKYQEYLYRLTSTKKMLEQLQISILSRQDLIDNYENIKIYVRGHNLFDIFYGRYKGEQENEILQKYIDAAPRETFADILDAVDDFVYFQNRIV